MEPDRKGEKEEGRVEEEEEGGGGDRRQTVVFDKEGGVPAHSLPFPISLLLAPRVCIRTYLPRAHVCTMYESMYLVRGMRHLS